MMNNADGILFNFRSIAAPALHVPFSRKHLSHIIGAQLQVSQLTNVKKVGAAAELADMLDQFHKHLDAIYGNGLKPLSYTDEIHLYPSYGQNGLERVILSLWGGTEIFVANLTLVTDEAGSLWLIPQSDINHASTFIYETTTGFITIAMSFNNKICYVIHGDSSVKDIEPNAKIMNFDPETNISRIMPVWHDILFCSNSEKPKVHSEYGTIHTMSTEERNAFLGCEILKKLG